MVQKVAREIIEEKLILDSNTGKPVKEILLEESVIKVVKEDTHEYH